MAEINLEGTLGKTPSNSFLHHIFVTVFLMIGYKETVNMNSKKRCRTLRLILQWIILGKLLKWESGKSS